MEAMINFLMTSLFRMRKNADIILSIVKDIGMAERNVWVVKITSF